MTFSKCLQLMKSKCHFNMTVELVRQFLMIYIKQNFIYVLIVDIVNYLEVKNKHEV